MPKWEKYTLVLLLILFVISMAANAVLYYSKHSVLEPKTGGSITIGLTGQPQNINPVLAANQVDQSIVHMVFSGLYTYNKNGELVPDLALDYPKQSEDGKQYTIRISPDAFWHDGAPVTSKDVIFTIKTIQDSKVNSPLRPLWLSTEVRAQDLHTLTFTTQETNAAFLHNLTFGLLPEHTWNSVSPEYFASSPLNQKPLGNGPYAIRQIKRNKAGRIENISLELFAQHTHPAKIQSLLLAFYQDTSALEIAKNQNSIDAYFVVPQTENLEQLSLGPFQASSTLPSYQGLYFNTQSPFLLEAAERQALSSAISWSFILDLWKGTVKPTSTTPLGLNTQPFSKYFVYGQPAELLKNSSLRVNSQGKVTKAGLPVKLRLAAPNTYPYPEIAKQIQTDWDNLGVETDIQLLSQSDLILNVVRPRKFDALLFFQSNSVDPEAFAFWHSSQAQDPGVNITQLQSEKVDQLITKARTSTNVQERAALYQELQTVLDAEAAAILYGQAVSYTYTQAKVLGVTNTSIPDPSWLLYTSTNWYLGQDRTFQK